LTNDGADDSAQPAFVPNTNSHAYSVVDGSNKDSDHAVVMGNLTTTFNVNASPDLTTTSRNLTVPANGTVAIMHFLIQNGHVSGSGNRPTAVDALAATLANTPGNDGIALTGMSSTIRGLVVNFNL